MQKRLTLEQIPRFSLFVRRTIEQIASQTGETVEEIATRYAQKLPDRQHMSDRLFGCQTSLELGRQMRILRRDTLLSIALCDISGRCGYEEVVACMSALAETCVKATVKVCSAELALRFGVPTNDRGQPEDLLVVAMGKLGGEELNVSSDIDLVFVYDEAGKTSAWGSFSSPSRSISNHEFFERLARRIIPLLNQPQEDGFVFRVDMRLRPFGESGPIVVSSEMLEEYLYTEGRDWERFAWLKARVINEAVFSAPEDFAQACGSLYALIQPFVYRKYVDFGALNALSRVHEMIRTQTVRRELDREPGVNVKLGRGGIREIEFIVQTFQVMRGGREPALRGRQTLAMLETAVQTGCLESSAAEKLSRGYVFLRNVEHALQYVDDKQTHFLTDDKDAHDRIAAMLGLETTELNSRLEAIREFVGRTFEDIFDTKDATLEREGWPVGWRLGDEAACLSLEEKLKELGFSRSDELARRICQSLTNRVLTRNPEARDQFAFFLMTLAENSRKWSEDVGSQTSADVLFERYLGLLEIIAGRPTYITLLNQYPRVAEKVAKILVSSRWASLFLYEHPLLLDELVSSRENRFANFSEEDWFVWEKEVKEKLSEFSSDIEALLNVLRDAAHIAVFRLLVADLQGKFTVERMADQLSALADAVLRIVLEIAWEATPSHHREKPQLAVIGYGKLGGKELGYASDLDLVFLYEDDAADAASIYARYVRRVINWLTAQTSSGKLYAVDTRLRPEGEDGLLVCSFEHFKNYQNELTSGAWVWEHQALTRARFCAGDARIGEQFEKERIQILRCPREKKTVCREVVAMRKKILESRKNTSGLFDLKRDRGGMVDVEFAVQTLVLTESFRYPELTKNLGNSALLEIGAKLGLIDADLADRAAKAYRKYRNIQRLTRLNLGENAPVRVEPESVRLEREAVCELWSAVLGTDEPSA